MKQFLKPDWRKILIFVILLIIMALFIMPVSTTMIFVDCVGGSCKNINPWVRGTIFSEIIKLISGEHSIFSHWGSFIIFILNFIRYELTDISWMTALIFYIIIFYLLSCLIFWGWDRLRKK